MVSYISSLTGDVRKQQLKGNTQRQKYEDYKLSCAPKGSLVGFLAEIICTEETINHLSFVPFKQSIHYTDLSNLTQISWIERT
jgi:hypothetical protein